jgi:hypothetical protein
MGTPTRFTYGVATVPRGYPLSSYPLPDPFNSTSDTGFGVATYSNDFMSVNAEDFTISGSGSTLAVASGLGGLAVLTPGGTTTATSAFKAGTAFGFVAGQKLWYTTRLQVSATTGAFTAGLASAGTSATDGLYFSTTGTTVNLVSRVGSTSTTLVSSVATLAANTLIELGFHYNNTDLVVYVNNQLVSRVTSPTIGASGTNLTSALLSTIFTDTPTATETMTIDYVLAAVEVSR